MGEPCLRKPDCPFHSHGLRPLAAYRSILPVGSMRVHFRWIEFIIVSVPNRRP